MSPRELATPMRGLTRWQTPHLFGTVHYDHRIRSVIASLGATAT